MSSTVPAHRRRRKEARPQELLDAALALFVEKGFAATRAEEVAAAAGVSKGTLYLYYPSKEELFKAVVRHNLSSLIAEGVEVEGQRDFLAENGCYDFQGYLYSKPLAIDEFEEFRAKFTQVSTPT